MNPKNLEADTPGTLITQVAKLGYPKSLVQHPVPPVSLLLKVVVQACILSIVKQITSPGGMHETSARAWCTGKTQTPRVQREVGGRIGTGNTCNSMADSCQCMTKPTEML